MKKFRNIIQRLSELSLYSLVCFLYYRVPVDERLVFFDTCEADDFSSDVLRIAQALSTGEYGSFKMAIRVNKRQLVKAKRLIGTYGLENVKLLTRNWASLLLMERAKYIVVDSSMVQGYVKKDGQVVLSFWREGCSGSVDVRANRAAVANAQNLFLNSDFCLFSSRFACEAVLSRHMVQNVMFGKALMAGYPRNAVFFDGERREVLRAKLGVRGKRVLAYIPTVKSIWQQDGIAELISILLEMDARLDDDQVVYAKPHPFIAEKVDYAQFVHVRPFPQEYDTYDILNAADCLVADHPSIFCDFANTGRKIILFAHGEDECLFDRGMCFDIDDLPFPVVQDVDDLVREISTKKEYCDIEFQKRFCTHDARNAVEDLCRHVFMGERRCREASLGNEKENVLIMGGGLAKNGITSSLVNLLSNVDLQQRNYFVSYRQWEIDCVPERLEAIPKGVSLLPLVVRKRLTLREHAVYRRFLKGKYGRGDLPWPLRRAFERERSRCFRGVEFSGVIQFDGYNKDATLLFSLIEGAKKSIFVHNDMRREIAEKKNQNAAVLSYAYRHYDFVAVVSSDLVEPTKEIGGSATKTVVVPNVLDCHSVRRRADAPIEFQDDTVVLCRNPEGVEGVLRSSGRKIISIGRFSPEKGHARLLRAFDEYCSCYSEDQLIIVGGSGALFEETAQLVSMMKHRDSVTLIKAMANPMPILSRCDLLVISSYYEGLPMVIGEADALGIPVLATDIVALRSFMLEHGGCLVDSTEEGIREGLFRFACQGVPALGIDFSLHNRNAVDAFDSLLRG